MAFTANIPANASFHDIRFPRQPSEQVGMELGRDPINGRRGNRGAQPVTATQSTAVAVVASARSC